MPILRPDADVADGNWTDESGGTTLFDKINESTANDSNYIKSRWNPANEACEIAFSNTSAIINHPFRVRFRYGKEGSGVIDMTVRLMQGATVIAEWVYTDIPAGFVDGEEALTEPQFAAITDPTDLRLVFVANQPSAAAPLDAYTTNLTGAWSFGRQLLSAYGGSFFTDAGGGAVSELFDQSGATRDLGQASAGSRPTATTAGPNSRACGDFVGPAGNDYLTGDTIDGKMSDFINADSGWLAVSAIVDAVTTNSGAAPWDNCAIISDFGQYLSCPVLRTTGGSGYTASSYNYDGNEDETAGIAETVGATPHVFEWRHEGGNIYVRVDGGSEQPVASGDTESISFQLVLGSCAGLGSLDFNGKIFEAVAYDVPPDETTRDAIVAAMLDWIG